jgi:hypothetical protein
MLPTALAATKAGMLDGENDVGRARRGRQRRDQCTDERTAALDRDRSDDHDRRRHRHLEGELVPEEWIGRHRCGGYVGRRRHRARFAPPG